MRIDYMFIDLLTYWQKDTIVSTKHVQLITHLVLKLFCLHILINNVTGRFWLMVLLLICTFHCQWT